MASSNKIGRMAAANVDKALAGISADTKPDMKGGDEALKAAVAPKKAQSFGEAFRAARADKGAGKTFTWAGKSYSTNAASDAPKRAAPTPAATVKRAAPTPAASTSNSRAKAELARTAARSQKNIRENRAENQADFRKRTQERNSATSGKLSSPVYMTKEGRDVIAGRTKAKPEPVKRIGYSTDNKRYAKGGSVDGCAVRGKTRAPMKKGK